MYNVYLMDHASKYNILLLFRKTAVGRIEWDNLILAACRIRATKSAIDVQVQYTN
jgi:hypothetical protein